MKCPRFVNILVGMAALQVTPECLIVFANHWKMLSLQSFLHTFTIGTSLIVIMLEGIACIDPLRPRYWPLRISLMNIQSPKLVHDLTLVIQLARQQTSVENTNLVSKPCFPPGFEPGSSACQSSVDRLPCNVYFFQVLSLWHCLRPFYQVHIRTLE